MPAARLPRPVELVSSSVPAETVNVVVPAELKPGSAAAERITLPSPLLVTFPSPSNEPLTVSKPDEAATFQVWALPIRRLAPIVTDAGPALFISMPSVDN